MFSLLDGIRIPLMELLNETNPVKYHWLLLQTEVESNLPQIKIWTMFIQNDKKNEMLDIERPVESFANQLLYKAESDREILDLYK